MKRTSAIITHSANDLAAALGLGPQDAVEMEVRRRLNAKIIEAVAQSGLTHAQAAKKARTSRTRLTAILNGNTQGVSTDLMLRILAALGYTASISFRRIDRAA